jgi:hypothetical protein
MEFIWLAIIAFLGSMVATFMCNVTSGGTLNIDRSNPEKDLYLFDVGDLEKLPKRKYIVLKVNPNANLKDDITHK